MRGCFNLHLVCLWFSLIGFRIIPEVLAGGFPIGFDTVTYYAPFIRGVQTLGFNSLLRVLFSQTAPLMYFILFPLGLTGVPPILLTKIVSPIIFGFTGLAVFTVLKDVLKISRGEAVLLAFFMCVNFMVLRFSWDMWRNSLGLIFYLLCFRELTFFDLNRRVGFKLLLFSLLSATSSELTAVLVAATMCLGGLHKLIKIRRLTSFTVILFIIGCLSGVLVFYYAHILQVFTPMPPDYPLEFISGAGGFASFQYDYIGGGGWYGFENYSEAVLTPIIIFLFISAPILPLLFKQKFECKWVNIFLLTCLIGSVSIIIFPYAAIPVWHRWMFMLVFPLLFYASKKLSSLGKRLKYGYFTLILVFGLGYAVLPPSTPFPYYSISSITYKYIPTSMLQNSISLEDSPSVITVLNWLDTYGFSNSCLMAYEPFMGWSRLYLQGDITIIPYDLSTSMLDLGLEYYDNVYVIWWIRGTGWYDWTPPPSLIEVFSSGDIAVYIYSP